MAKGLRIGRYLLAGAAVIAAGSIAWRSIGRDVPGNSTVAASTSVDRPAPDVTQMITTLQARLRDTPDDAAGWRTLGWSYFNLQRFGEAAAAYRRATALAPGEAETWSALGETLVLGGKGVGPEAAAAFDKALAIDPKDARARYFLAVRQDMQGDHKGAVEAWIALLRDGPADAPWAQSVRDLVTQVAAREKIDVAGRLPTALPPAPPPALASGVGAAIPGPDATQLAAAARLSPSEQDAMARGMVDRLAQRLARDPRDAEGWLRLMRARMTLGDRAGAAQALATARRTFVGDATTLAQFDEGAAALSL